MEDKVYRTVKNPNGVNHYQVYVPAALRSKVLVAFHDNPLSGHFGRFKTLKRIQKLAYWPKMWKDVVTYVRNCTVCQTLKPETRRLAGKIQQTVVGRPWEMLGIDLMGPLPRSTKGNTQLLVIVDYYSRWVELFPLRKATAEVIGQILIREIFTRWGTPDYLLSDRGSQFISHVLQAVCEKWQVVQKLTTAYHPQTNLTERVNRTLKPMMASYVSDQHKKWDRYLCEFRFAINSAVQESTGYSPAEVNLGRILGGPLEKVFQHNASPDLPSYELLSRLSKLRAAVQENVSKAQARQKRNYNKYRRDVSFNLKDRVWVRNHPQSKAATSYTTKFNV